MNGEELIPIICSLGLFAMIFGIRSLKNREKIAMIEKGMNPNENRERPAPYISLKFGLLLLGAGLGLFIAYFIDIFALQGKNGVEAIYFALIGVGGGLGLIISYIIEKKEWYDKKGE